MPQIVFDEYPKVSLDAFVPELALEIPELPTDIIKSYIRGAAIEFARRSAILQRHIPICTEECVENYLIEPPDCMDIIAIAGIKTDDCQHINRLSFTPQHLTCVGTSSWWERPNVLWLSPALSCPTRVTVSAVVAPRADSCEVDEVLYTHHREAIQAGARERLYAIPRRPWSSQPVSENNRLEFDRRIASAGVDRLLGGQLGSRRMRSIWNNRR